jgi:hypothetical protein
MRPGSPSDLDGLIGIYELNRVELLRDVYLWAYERSPTYFVSNTGML